MSIIIKKICLDTFDKSKSSDKIDGMVALAMAMGAYMIDRAEGGSTESVYNDRDIFFL